MTPEIRTWSCKKLMKQVAFFKDLKVSKGGLPDSDLLEYERELINVIGFQPPEGEGQIVSPVGRLSMSAGVSPLKLSNRPIKSVLHNNLRSDAAALAEIERDFYETCALSVEGTTGDQLCRGFGIHWITETFPK